VAFDQADIEKDQESEKLERLNKIERLPDEKLSLIDAYLIIELAHDAAAVNRMQLCRRLYKVVFCHPNAGRTLQDIARFEFNQLVPELDETLQLSELEKISDKELLAIDAQRLIEFAHEAAVLNKIDFSKRLYRAVIVNSRASVIDRTLAKSQINQLVDPQDAKSLEELSKIETYSSQQLLSIDAWQLIQFARYAAILKRIDLSTRLYEFVVANLSIHPDYRSLAETELKHLDKT
jgi:hypothetical protein